MKKILVYPYYDNPYQDLLYKEIQKKSDVKIAYLRSKKYDGYLLMLFLPWMILDRRLHGFTIFHIHWVAFNPQSKNKLIKSIAFLYTCGILLFIKLLGFKLLWTIHDITPHTALTVHDISITKLLCKLCTAKIALSQRAIVQLQNLHCDTRNIVVIPHGNYTAYYHNNVTFNNAREFLHINKQEYVFLFLGQLKLYKGIDDLLEVFSKLSQHNKNCTLVIAGKVYEDSLYDVINSYKYTFDNSLKLYLRHIKDDEIQYFMNAADIIVYPCKRITNSGSVLLALSFGKAIIYPQIGALKDLPENIGFSYISEKKDGLYTAIVNAISATKKQHKLLEKNAYEYAQTLNWENIAQKTIDVYNNI